IQLVIEWLASQGFLGIKVGTGRTAVEFSGNAGSVRKAFHTEIHRYLVYGEEHLANSSDPQVPAELKPLIAGVVSLHDFRKKPLHHLVDSSRHSRTGANPEYTFNCVDFFTSVFGSFPGQSPTCHPLGPYDFATIYRSFLWAT